MATDAGARVLILSPTVIQEDPSSEGNRRLKMYIQAGQEVARERKAEYVNLHEMFLRMIEKRRKLDQEGKLEADENLTTDGVHMTPMGDTMMAVGLLRTLGVPDAKISTTDLSEVFGE
jgi:lysophospholipase L1-like esterase